jgi:Hypothetical glycosyl hydrolase family 15
MRLGQRRLAARGGRRRHPLYPPSQLPPHPQLQTRRAWIVPAIVVLVAVVVGAIVIAVTTHAHHTPYANGPYTPQPQRSAEVVGNPTGALSDEAIDDIAKNDSYEVLPKFADRFNISKHFDETTRLVDAAKKYGNHLKVFDYFSASYWFNANQDAWGDYASGFQDSWLLRDSTGKTIPYFGSGGALTTGSTIKGYVLDLSNPGYRAWALATIVSWMKAAPYSGISFDSAAPMQGSGASRFISDGATTYNSLLCGPTVALATTDCSRVQAWNQGLVDLLTQTSAALHLMGDEVRYNGIAPTPLRGPSRNLGLLQNADIASNEGFCLSLTSNPDKISFNSLVDDVVLMQQIAAQHKKVFEITNTYNSAAKTALGQYCLAGFLVGWQPGSSYFTFHPGYSYPPDGSYPVVPEQNLNLGNPLTVGYQTSGTALTRRFANGFVAANPAGSPTTITVPADVVAFKGGSAGDTYPAGSSVVLPAHGGLLALNRSFVYGSGTSK